jgi:hypothetical protein
MEKWQYWLLLLSVWIPVKVNPEDQGLGFWKLLFIIIALIGLWKSF